MPRKTRTAPSSPPAARRSFNEAAARCRGKRHSPPRGCRMRAQGFNEAAARCRGKHPRAAAAVGRGRRFNEAAARCRGKLRSPALPVAERASFNEAAARCRGKLQALQQQADQNNAALQ